METGDEAIELGPYLSRLTYPQQHKFTHPFFFAMAEVIWDDQNITGWQDAFDKAIVTLDELSDQDTVRLARIMLEAVAAEEDSEDDANEPGDISAMPRIFSIDAASLKLDGEDSVRIVGYTTLGSLVEVLKSDYSKQLLITEFTGEQDDMRGFIGNGEIDAALGEPNIALDTVYFEGHHTTAAQFVALELARRWALQGNPQSEGLFRLP